MKDIHTNQPLKNTIVTLHPNNLVTFTDSQGFFFIENLKPATYDLEFKLLGYQTLIIPRQKLYPKHIINILAEMTKSNENSKIFFIGGIEVSANRIIEFQKPYTSTEISSSHIEHIQATSLGDALELAPGVEIRTQSALKDVKRAILRDPREINELSSFGTKIIIDGIPVTNNANLQEANSTFNEVATSSSNGIDLRSIPAENIESIEVIRGIAPVQYGDYLSGIVNVKTKSFDTSRQRIKLKNNPDTKEMNLGGAFKLWNTKLDYNLNWAQSLKDLRKENDDAQRLSFQTTVKKNLLGDRVKTVNNIQFSKLSENHKEDPNDNTSYASYNHGYRLLYGMNNEISVNQSLQLQQQFYVNYRKVDCYKQRYLAIDNQVISTLLEDGTMIGVEQLKGYIYRYFTKGKEISAGLNVNIEKLFFIHKSAHTVSFGTQLQYDDNIGLGKQFNINEPPYPGERPRDFNSVPGIFIQSIYFNDQMLSNRLKNIILNFGLRYERYTQTKTSFFRSPNGAFMNPRVQLSYSISKNLHIRMGYGIASKAPSVNFIYPQSKYIDVTDYGPNYITNTGLKLLASDSLKSTYVLNRSNVNLKGTQEKKWELSLAYSMRYFTFNVVGFYNERSNEPIQYFIPYLYHQYNRPEWPEKVDESIARSFLTTYSKYENSGWSRFNGIEFNLSSKTIEKINTNFSFDATYYYSKHGIKGMKAGIPTSLQLPYYNQSTDWFEKLILNFQINYTSKVLGIWVSLFAQYVPHSISKKIGYADSLANAYYDANKEKTYIIPEEEKLNDEFKKFRLSLDPVYYACWRYPEKWLFNFRISKLIFKGCEISFYVNNFLNNRAYYKSFTNSQFRYSRNPEIFYGIEISTIINEIFKGKKDVLEKN